jgi:hypothetical protein
VLKRLWISCQRKLGIVMNDFTGGHLGLDHFCVGGASRYKMADWLYFHISFIFCTNRIELINEFVFLYPLLSPANWKEWKIKNRYYTEGVLTLSRYEITRSTVLWRSATVDYIILVAFVGPAIQKLMYIHTTHGLSPKG